MCLAYCILTASLSFIFMFISSSFCLVYCILTDSLSFFLFISSSFSNETNWCSFHNISKSSQNKQKLQFVSCILITFFGGKQKQQQQQNWLCYCCRYCCCYVWLVQSDRIVTIIPNRNELERMFEKRKFVHCRMK